LAVSKVNGSFLPYFKSTDEIDTSLPASTAWLSRSWVRGRPGIDQCSRQIMHDLFLYNNLSFYESVAFAYSAFHRKNYIRVY